MSMACTSMQLRGGPAEALQAASAVLSGKGLDITEGGSSPPATGLKELAVKFRVEKSEVSTVNKSNLCGFPFGVSYLVYARGGNKLTTDT